MVTKKLQAIATEAAMVTTARSLRNSPFDGKKSSDGSINKLLLLCDWGGEKMGFLVLGFWESLFGRFLELGAIIPCDFVSLPLSKANLIQEEQLPLRGRFIHLSNFKEGYKYLILKNLFGF